MTPSVLADLARLRPHDVCLVDAETDETVSYRILHDDSLALAHVLQGLDVGESSVVATMFAHSIDTYRVWFGLARLGALEVPIGTRYRGQMLHHIIDDSGAQVLILDAEHLPTLEESLAGRSLSALRTVVVRGDRQLDLLDHPDLPGVAVVSLAELQAGTGGPVDGSTMRTPQPWDLATVIYTSGTTGPSKGVLVPWGQVHATVAGAFPEGTLRPGKVIYGPFPPNHIGGRLFVCLGIENGLPVVVRHVFSASAFWPDVEKYRCTTVGLVSAMASILLAAPAREADAGHPLEDVLMVPMISEHRDFAARFGVRLCTSYNMTEVSIPIVSDWSADDWRSSGEVRSGYPGYQLTVVDEHDQPLGPGQVGELVCRTEAPWTMNAGYLGRPGETAAAWRNGWFHTGDAFRYDERGRYYFVDRVKDAIRRRGENVSSFEVEREVLDHPDVVACAAIGVPSELGEEDIKVFAIPRGGSGVTPEEVVAHVATRAASFMVPRYVELVDALPATEGTNRVRKAELRELERRRRGEPDT